MGEKAKKVLSVIANVILWAVIILAAFFAFVTLATKDPNQVGNFLGYTPMSVQTDSMSPTFNAGDLIIIKKIDDPNTLQVGDIVTFHTIIEDQYALNTHRIKSIADGNGYRTYVTKGDNNPIEDEQTIANGDIVGKYVGHVPYLGKVLDFLQSSVGFFICLLLPMLGFLVYQIYNLIQVAIRYKKAAALEQAEEVARVQAEAMLKAQKAAGIVPENATAPLETPAPAVAATPEAAAPAPEKKEAAPAEAAPAPEKKEKAPQEEAKKEETAQPEAEEKKTPQPEAQKASAEDEETARLKAELAEAKRRLAEAMAQNGTSENLKD